MEGKSVAQNSSLFNMNVANCSILQKFAKIVISFFSKVALKFVAYGLSQKNAFSSQNLGLLELFQQKKF